MRMLRTPVWAAALLIATIGCGEAPVDDHGHAHEPIMLSAAAWSDAHELFVEHAPLVAGRETAVRILLTDLAEGAPAEGALALRWTHAQGAVVEIDPPASGTPGVWTAPTTLPEPGLWTLTATPSGGAPLALPPTRAYGNAHAAEHAESAEDPDAVVLLKEQQWRFGVRSEPAVAGPFAPATEIAAVAEAPTDRRVVVSTPVAGRLAAPEGRALAAPGTRVSAGDPLGVIRAAVSGGGGDLAEARAGLVRAEEAHALALAELERARALYAAEAGSERRVREAEAAAAQAAADLEAARGLAGDGDDDRSDGEGTELMLRAPIDGVVTRVALSAGEFADGGAPVFTVLDPTVVWVRGWIPESALAGLGGAPGALLLAPGAPPRELTSRDLVFLSPELDARTRAASVVYAVDNAGGGLRVGQSLSLRLRTGRVDAALTVPDAALVDEQGRPVVFVQTGGETFAKRPLVLGASDGVRHVVVEGLAPGERVVVDGAWVVKLASADDAVPAHGHTH